MRLHRLELTGFGPFRETQVVDFDDVADDGLFLISGRTGTGKSSILDGVSFALYGSVPRYDGGERRLRSDHCELGDPTEVRLEFTIGESRWRVTRAPEYERPAKRGGGVTLEATRAELEEFVDDVWVGRAARPRDVGVLLDEVLGLSAQQFQQVILLAQNKFSRFLLARNDERQALLRTLFGTRRFEQYKADLDERRKDAQRRWDAAGEKARTLLDLAERIIDENALASDADRPIEQVARREAAETALLRAGYRVEQATTARSLADTVAEAAAATLADTAARAKTFVDLAAVRAAFDDLEQESPRIDGDRARLERARRAEALRATLDVAARALAAHAAGTDEADAARTAWLDAGGDERDDLAAIVDELTRALGVWAAAADDERELQVAEVDLARLGAAVDEPTARIAAIDAEREGMPALRRTLDDELAAARESAAQLTAARTAQAGVSSALVAAREAAELALRVAQAEAAYAERSATADAAGASVTRLLRRRLDGYAGELALHLVDDEPCAVCGSTSHPHPAAQGDDPVTDERLAAAEAARDEAASAAATAGEHARSIRARHAEAAARAGGRTVEVLEAEHARAVDAVRVAEEAELRAAGLVARLAEVEKEDAAHAVERERLVARQAADREALAALTATVSRLRLAVADARGEYDSVAARIAVAEQRRARARASLAAQERIAEAVRGLAAADADLAALVAASGFDDAQAAAASLLAVDEQALLDARIAEHTAARTATRARLLELELAATDLAPPSPDDLARARQERVDAEAARSAAIAAHRDAENVAASLAALLAQTDDAYTAVAATAADAAVVTRLADSVAGRAPNTMKMDLETFVLAAELEEIVAAANLRLAEMSDGRYSLVHTDARQARNASSGLGIEVFDGFTGQARTPQSLSGGETFLASLSLALGLAEIVTAQASGIRLDTLFIDEGFGSLDAETLELAMETLDELRHGGRTVGVISHVESMKNRLTSRIVVESTSQGASIIRRDVAEA